MNKKCLSIIVLIGIWQLLSMLTDREVLLPQPIHVFTRIYEMLLSGKFYGAVATTLLRANLSFLIALILGISLGLLAAFHSQIEAFLNPILSFLQTIPQISYMIILLVWFDQFMCILIIILLMKNIDVSLIDIIRQYQHPMPFLIFKVYLPLIKPYIYSAIDAILPLSLKIGVMAEVLIQTRTGIGAQLYLARLNIDMTGVFAWTICLVILLMLEVKIVHLGLRK